MELAPPVNVTVLGTDPWFTGPVRALARGLRHHGCSVEIRHGMPPVSEEGLIVVLGAHDHGPPPSGPATTVAIWTEHDSSKFFQVHSGMDAAKCFAVTRGWYDITFDMLGARAVRLGLPFLPAWPEVEADPTVLDLERRDEVLWYGTITPRRREILASIANEVELIIPTAPIWGGPKEEALRSAKVVVLPHAWDGPCGEPIRYADAAATGPVLVCESAEEFLPYEPGMHFVSVPADEMGKAARLVLQKWDEFRPMRSRALYNAVAFDSCHAAKVLLDNVSAWRNRTSKKASAGVTGS